jgi:hypothetical protein
MSPVAQYTLLKSLTGLHGGIFEKLIRFLPVAVAERSRAGVGNLRLASHMRLSGCEAAAL